MSFFTGRPNRSVRLSVAVLGVLALAACSDDSGQQQSASPPPPSVSVVAAVNKQIQQSVSFVGQVAAVDEVNLVARVSGFLEKKEVEDGAVVKQGELLFQIEKQEYEAALERAKADLASSKADAALKAADEKRDKDLLEKGHVSEAAYEATLAQKEQADAAVQASDAALKQAELNLSYTDVKAPFPGQIGKTTYSVGEVVGPNTQSLARLIQLAPVYVNFSVSESEYLDAVQKHQIDPTDPTAGTPPKLRLVLPNGQDYGETGEIVFIDNRVDPQTGTIAMRGKFENANNQLLAGVYVTVIIEAPQETTALVIPQAAIQRDQKGPFVLVVNSEQTVEQRSVTLGAQTGADFVVTKGLQEGETVIVQGLQKVRPGVPVNAVLANQPEAQS
ncbi:membrane fusion protein (multidrug efflux system) [Roseibium hamelinense]|uniref:Membrane fusion protein (Multidrug efflux system) n=1 Tax=Roseibium hamelinense TaxID=150831 RepID=A0A562THJ8_9HYPH|nr:efflux RND transporter periplasmic adaptor subunit [Roseibium hamelinense]MTI45722.1 efflux RND transporter periplasmic adaptor subunit [Roseibium hamelinense]TWI93095.1 membrane fusion protein (multidrug efflux system) [Roseibium hamelinense]